MTRYLWIGSFITESEYGEAERLGYRNAASYVSQKNILEGLERVMGITFDSVNALVYPAYPQCPAKYIKDRIYHHAENANDVAVGFLNYKYINKISSSRNLSKAVWKWLKTTQTGDNDNIEIFIYELRSACLKAAVELKKKHGNTKIHVIVPDLPLFMDLNMGKLKTVLKQYDYKKMQIFMRNADDYILYAGTMAKYLRIEDKKWMVMEGSINIEEIRKLAAEEHAHDKIVVMYSGFIDERYGILKLADSLKYLDDRFEIWITGGGPAQDVLKSRAQRDGRIKFYGYLPTRKELVELQLQATFFINLRDPDEEASQYCFPSKIFEYLQTGKPVISSKLKGIPQEYFDYMIMIEKFTSESIAEAIKRAAAMTFESRNELGMAGRKLVIEKKNNIYQAKRIAEFTGYEEINK